MSVVWQPCAERERDRARALSNLILVLSDGGRVVHGMQRREQQMRKAELKAVQKDTSGADTLEAWKALKDEGKVLSSDDMSRDTDTNVLGSKDGLIAERIDENLPYIDQGYVAEDAGPDLSKALGDALGGLFGKKDDQR